VSSQEYWLLNRTNGISNVAVTLSFNASRSGGITTLADLRVAEWNGTMWTDQGNTSTTGTNSNGTVKSNPALADFGPFTLASSTNSNTLPLSLLSFTALQQNSGIVLSWQTENEVNVSNFNIQQSIDGNNFNTIGNISANGAAQYSYIDNVSTINASTVFYRLQIMDKNGGLSYSKTIAAILKKNITTINIFPNPVKETLFVQLSSVKTEKITLQVVDRVGRILQQQEVQVSVGITSLSVDASSLLRGIYTLLIRSNDNQQQKQFVKD
jgi:hypothetical protein